MKKKLIEWIHPLSLFFIVMILVWKNYIPGTWLTGWDNLHPEFNFGLNIYRSIFSAWQEYQGLGLLAGMAHAADLPHQLFLLLLSFAVPASSLRYAFHFIMLFSGTMGVYFLAKNMFLAHVPGSIKKHASFLAALFYLLNLGTIQYFFVPFEPYSTFWGMFPWELYVFFKFLRAPGRKNALLLATVNLLSVPQAYVQTLFVVYAICLACVAAAETLRDGRHRLRASAAALMIILFMNAFWLLPNIYFTLHDVGVTEQAVNNRMNTQRFFQVNKNHGTPADFALLKEFYFDFVNSGINTPGNYYMMQPWRDHFSGWAVTFAGYCLFGVIILGLFHKSAYRRHLFFLFLLSCLAFLSATPVIAETNALLRTIPLVNQIFRNPFTKFIVPATLVFSILFGSGMAILLRSKIVSSSRYLQAAAGAIGLVFIIVVGFPAFRGNLFFNQSRLKIPAAYFQLFDYMNSRNGNGRIMNMPQDSYWGWGSYRWGSIGSGFLWYGIKQPIMDRAFDVWSSELEQYYWELQYALKKEDQNLFNAVLSKYRIGYIIFDEAYIPSDSMPIKYLLRQEETMLKNNPQVHLDREFGVIRIYRTDLDDINPVLIKNVPTVKRNGPFDYRDPVYDTVHSYADKAQRPDYIFPFSSVFTNKTTDPSLTQDGDSFMVENKLPEGDFSLSLPSLLETEKLIPARFFARHNQGRTDLLMQIAEPQITVGGRAVPDQYRPVEMTVNADEDAVLSINNRDFYPVRNLTGDYRLLGTAYLPNDGTDISLKLFSLSQGTSRFLSPEQFSSALPCEKQSADATVSSQRTNGGISLSSVTKPACTTYGESFPSSSAEILYRMDFSYTSKKYERPKYCFFNNTYNTCLNRDLKAGFAREKKQVTDYFEAGGSIGDSYLNLVLEPYKSQKEKGNTITYNDLILTGYPLLDKLSVKLGGIQPVPVDESAYHSDGSMPFRIMYPKMDNSGSFASIIGDSMYVLQSESNKLQRGDSVAYEQPDKNGTTIKQYAKNNLVNFWVNLNGWDNSAGSIVSVTSRTVTGMPTTLNISSITHNYKFVNTYLPVNRSQTTDAFLVGPYDEYDDGLQILFNSNSYNESPSVFDLKDISVYPFPYTFISRIFLKNNTYVPEEEFTSFFTNAHYSVYSYGLALPDVTTNDTVVLPQGFHDGWVMYDLKERKTAGFWQMNFPFLYGSPVNTHVRVDNWANGWSLTADQHNHLVIIAFLPQQLQFIGFGLLIPAFLYIIFVYGRIFPPAGKESQRG